MKTGMCHVVGAGDFKAELLKIKDGDIVIACDGGYAHLNKAGIICDFCLGDFDSLGYVPAFPKIKVLPTQKDVTDMEAGIRYGMEMGYRRFKLYGALGGDRISHSYANIQSAAGIVKNGGECYIVDEKCEATVMYNEERIFDKGEYAHVSVFAYGEKIKVELKGFKYGEGRALELDPFYPIGVSNEFKENSGTIRVEGTAVIFFEKV